MQRGEVWWADFGDRRPVVLLSYEETAGWRAMYVVEPAAGEIDQVAVEVPVGTPEGLPQAGVLRVAIARPGFIPCTWLVTLDQAALIERAGVLSSAKLAELAEALRRGGIE